MRLKKTAPSVGPIVGPTEGAVKERFVKVGYIGVCNPAVSKRPVRSQSKPHWIKGGFVFFVPMTRVKAFDGEVEPP